MTPAVKPHHLEEHFQSKRVEDTHKSCFSAERSDSFIAARKQKLADKLKYVQKVMIEQRERRERIAEKKRKTIQQQQQEAARKRENSLRKISTKCSAKVDHAKRVSRQQKIQEMSLRQTQRENIAKRMNDSAERREKLLRKGKALFDSQSNTKKNSAIKIQSWFRARFFGGVLEKLQKVNLDSIMNSKKENEIDFNTMSRKLISRYTIACAKELFGKISQIDSTSCKRQNVSRVFLSSYMIVACPESVFSTNGDAESVLKKSALEVVDAFRKWTKLYKSLQGAKYFGDFLKVWKQYRLDFDDWKQIDQSRLVDGLVAHYMELEALKETVSGNPETEAHWFPNIESQQDIIYKKLVTLGNSKALRKLKRKSRIECHSNEPGPSEDDKSSSELDTSFEDSEDVQEELPSDASDGFVGSSDVEDSSQLAQPTWQSSRVYPEDFGSNENISLSDGLTNEKLAHELAINPLFRFKPHDERRDEKAQIRASAREFFRKTLSKELKQSPPDLSRIPKVLDDVRKSLLDAAMGSKTIETQVNDALDLDFIAQQISYGAFDLAKCLKFIHRLMSQLCAPVRDERVRRLLEIDDPADIFVEMFEILSLMKLDLANYHIETVLPYIQMHSVEYERKKFQDRIDQGDVSLNLTTDWLKKFVLSTKQPNDFEEILSSLFVELLMTVDNESESATPETFAMDFERLVEMRRQLLALIKTEAVLTVVKTVASILRDETEFLDELKETILILFNHSGTSMEDIYVQITKSIDEFQERTWKRNFPASMFPLMKGMIKKTESENDTIRSLISQRITKCMRAVVRQPTPLIGGNKGSTKTVCEVDALGSSNLKGTAEEMIDKLALSEVKSELLEVFERSRLLFLHNRRVYAPFYDRIIRDFV